MAPTPHLTIITPIPRRGRPQSNRPSSPQGQKQLSARRGSVSAPDPHGIRTTPPPRSTLSKLTIVRVPQPKPLEETVASSRGSKHQRRQSLGRTSSPGPASPSRLSFASASFSAPTSPTQALRSPGLRPASPARMSFASASFIAPGRPQSPSTTRRHTRTASASSQCSVSNSFERLTPTQTYELAKASSRPTANVVPSGYDPSSSFTQLAEDVYLPFLDRPSEVHELFSHPANKKVLVLFARMLPSFGEDYYPRTSAELSATVGSWTFEDFTTWLTLVSREEIEDADWVRVLRMFVLPKSEVLWERLKGILGVLPELDVDIDVTPEIIERPPTKAKEAVVYFTPIHPAPFSSGMQLDDISENAEEGATNTANEVVGLRISTTISSSLSSVKTVPSSPRSRTPIQGSVPHVSSPLVPKPVNPPRPKSAPPQKNSTGTSLSGLLSRMRSRDAACPMFPSSFDKLGLQPSLLSIG